MVVRLRSHQSSRDHMARRLAEGKTKTEVIRCLERYVARELYRTIMGPSLGACGPEFTALAT